MMPGANGFGFAATRWTLVERARGTSPEAQAAHRELCAAYYSPVVAFLKYETRGSDSARDWAHEFFAKLLQRDLLAQADPQRGRFRSYLLGAVKHFVQNKRREARREKRGNGQEILSIEEERNSRSPVDAEDGNALPPDTLFDREWALAIIERALLLLQQESEAADQGGRFAVLKAWLGPAISPQSTSEAAAALGLSEGAFKVAVHRLRKRFRELVRSEVAETLEPTEDLEGEMHHLVDALARR
jgi:RNA polymerase sigma factor (sigma-70 family)